MIEFFAVLGVIAFAVTVGALAGVTVDKVRGPDPTLPGLVALVTFFVMFAGGLALI